MHKSLMIQLEHMRKNHSRRYLQWFTEGKKDGLCGLCKGDDEVPRPMREAYINGHAFGMITREVA